MGYLVATGGASHSTVALSFAAHLAIASGVELTVLTVVKREQDLPAAQAILERARLVLEPFRIHYNTLVRVGHPAEEILAEAESGRFALVIVGEKQHHTLTTRFLLGSTALRVVEHAPCPAVVVKGRVGRVHRVLLCDSGVYQEPLIDRFSEQLPQLLSGIDNITVLHVMSQIAAMPHVRREKLDDMGVEELVAERSPEGAMLLHDLDVLKRTGHRAHLKVRHGLVVEEILAEAREGDHDLVVIGAHRGTGWRRILLDDIAHQIIIGLDRPVLVVR